MNKSRIALTLPSEEQLQAEILFTTTFIRREKRDRWKEFLASPKNRNKIVETLNHFRDLDERYLVAIPQEQREPEALSKMLHRLGAPEACHLISSADVLDGKTLPLLEALQRISSEGWGTLLLCLPDSLGYFYDEEGQNQWILKKP